MDRLQLVERISRTKGIIESFAAWLNNYSEEFLTSELLHERDIHNSNIAELDSWIDELQNPEISDLHCLEIQCAYRNKYGYL